MSEKVIERDWTRATAIANSDEELHEKIEEGWRVKTYREETGTVTETELEEQYLDVEFDDSPDGEIHVGVVKYIARLVEPVDHSGREPEDTEEARQTLEDILGESL